MSHVSSQETFNQCQLSFTSAIRLTFDVRPVWQIYAILYELKSLSCGRTVGVLAWRRDAFFYPPRLEVGAAATTSFEALATVETLMLFHRQLYAFKMIVRQISVHRWYC